MIDCCFIKTAGAKIRFTERVHGGMIPVLFDSKFIATNGKDEMIQSSHIREDPFSMSSSCSAGNFIHDPFEEQLHFTVSTLQRFTRPP
jgi:hypothetical protein